MVQTFEKGFLGTFVLSFLKIKNKIKNKFTHNRWMENIGEGRRAAADFHLDVSVLNDCTFIMLHHQSMSGLDSAPYSTLFSKMKIFLSFSAFSRSK